MRTVLVNAVSAKSGGAETYICNLLRSLSDAPFRFVVLVPADRMEQYRPAGSAELVGIGGSAGTSWGRLIFDHWTIRTLVKKFEADILLASSDFGTLFAPCRQLLMVRNALFFSDFYARNILARKPLQDRIEYWVKHLLVRASVKSADVVVAASHAMQDAVARFVRVPDERMRVNPFGVDLARFRLSPPRRALFPGNESGGLTRILYVSEYADYKNLTTLLTAIGILARRGIGNFRLVSTLDPRSFPEVNLVSRAADIALCDRQDVAQHLDMVGKVPYSKVEELFRDSDIFVFPSLVESFGHPLVEAMASGLPIVASDIPINREMCGDAAVYFSPLSADELANALETLIDDIRLRRQLGAIGRARAEEAFDWNDHMRRMMGILETLAGAEPHLRGRK